MKTRRAPAAPQKDGAETGMVTANVMNAVTSGCLLETGDQTEDVELNGVFLMGDQANATQLQMKT